MLVTRPPMAGRVTSYIDAGGEKNEGCARTKRIVYNTISAG